MFFNIPKLNKIERIGLYILLICNILCIVEYFLTGDFVEINEVIDGGDIQFELHKIKVLEQSKRLTKNSKIWSIFTYYSKPNENETDFEFMKFDFYNWPTPRNVKYTLDCFTEADGKTIKHITAVVIQVTERID